MSTIRDSVRERVQQLAALRDDLEQREASLSTKRRAFDELNAEEITGLLTARRWVSNAEADVQGLALVTYETTGEKRPCGGVSIAITKEYDVDALAAFVWAQQTNMALIPATLNLKVIKKLATVQALPFVTVRDVPKARIASDLRAALDDEPSEEMDA